MSVTNTPLLLQLYKLTYATERESRILTKYLHAQRCSAHYQTISVTKTQLISRPSYIVPVKMVGTIFVMMEACFKAKTPVVEPPTEDILKKHKFTRQSAQEYEEKTGLLKFKIYDNFDNAGKLKDELWNLLGKENILEEWDIYELLLMTNNAGIFDAIQDERLLQDTKCLF
jgi:heterodisulfide reductase subunit B